MSHEFIHKKAIVLGYRNYGERDRYYNLLIEDEGLRYVRVQGVRDAKSKHRYSLGLFTSPNITYLHGKEYRLIGVQEDEYLATTEEYIFAMGFLTQILRMVEFEDTEQKLLYDFVRKLHQEIVEEEHASRVQIMMYLSYSILSFIGYTEEKHEHMPLKKVILIYDDIHAKVRTMIFEHRELGFLNEYLDII